MKGLFIPGITAEMFRNGCLESIEALMAEGEIYDIDYQQPCEDAVSRKDVHDMLENLPVTVENKWFNWLQKACLRLAALPPVTPKEKTGWIPVSEDAPQKGTICLWCNKQGSVFTSAITYRSENDSYVGKHGYFSNGLENYGDIVAWMPLPAPFEPQESEG